jgi:hypothetical protein
MPLPRQRDIAVMGARFVVGLSSAEVLAPHDAHIAGRKAGGRDVAFARSAAWVVPEVSAPNLGGLPGQAALVQTDEKGPG